MHFLIYLCMYLIIFLVWDIKKKKLADVARRKFSYAIYVHFFNTFFHFYAFSDAKK